MSIRPATERDLLAGSVQQAFMAMYAHFETIGGRPFVDPESGRRWARNHDRLTGRSRLILLAEDERGLTGFVEGSVRLAPAQLRPETLGFVNHLWVDPERRRSGVGRQLVARLWDWFLEKQVAAVELQVVQGNEAALAFWRSAGFAPDLLQMRRTLGEGGSP